jgi:hypothetical protein
MNRTQLKVLWIGIGLIVLMGLFPPGRGGYRFILDTRSVSLGHLCIEWALVVVVTGGLIYSLKFDPELMLKIPCLLSSLLHNLFPLLFKQSYQEILKEAKENKRKIIVFWVIVLVLLLLALIVAASLAHFGLRQISIERITIN